LGCCFSGEAGQQHHLHREAGHGHPLFLIRPINRSASHTLSCRRGRIVWNSTLAMNSTTGGSTISIATSCYCRVGNFVTFKAIPPPWEGRENGRETSDCQRNTPHVAAGDSWKHPACPLGQNVSKCRGNVAHIRSCHEAFAQPVHHVQEDDYSPRAANVFHGRRLQSQLH